MNLSDDFIDALLADFEAHGAATIRRVAKERPADYVRLLASTVPAQIGIEHRQADSGLDDLDPQVLLAAVNAVLKG